MEKMNNGYDKPLNLKGKTYEDIKFDHKADADPDMPKVLPSTGLPAAKHFDMVMGVDIHFVKLPTTPVFPMPHPHVSMVYDFKEMLPPILLPKALIAPLGAVMSLVEPLTKNMFGKTVGEDGSGQSAMAHQLTKNKSTSSPVQTESASGGSGNGSQLRSQPLAKKAGSSPDQIKSDPEAGPWMPDPTIGIGANVFVNGLRRTQVTTGSVVVPKHIAMGLGFSFPHLIKEDGQAFMGSSSVIVEGMPFTYAGLPFLSCQCIGMVAPPSKAKGGKSGFYLPTAIVMPIPAGRSVNIGGSPIPFLSPFGAFKAFRKFQKGSKAFRKLSQKLNKLLNKKKKGWLSKAICTATGHPVDVASGNFFTDKVDFELPGQIPLIWERSYYSRSDYDGPIGHGWHHSYDIFLTPLKDDLALMLRTPDGRDVFVPELEVGGLHYDREEKIIFFRDEQSYGYRTNAHEYYRFTKTEKEGRYLLKEISTKNGHAIQFKQNENGHLIQIIDSAGRELTVENDDLGRITAIHVAHPKLENERIYLVRYDYDSQNRLTKAQDALDQFMRFEYDGTLMVRETDRNGLSFYFEYDYENRCYHTWGDGGIYDHHLDFYDGYTIVTNSLGKKINYSYNDAGVVTQVIDPKGGITTLEYNEYHELLMETDPEGFSTSYCYDEFGNKTGVLKPEGAMTNIQYEQNLPKLIKDPMGNLAHLKYDDCGNLIQVIEDKVVKNYEYENGLLTTIIEGDNKTHLAYDQYKNLSEVIAPDNTRTTWKFDSLGRCISTTDIKNNQQIYVFDKLNRLLQTTNGETKQKFAYDGEGNVTKANDGKRNVAFEYSGMNRLTSRSENGTRVDFHYNTEEDLLNITNEQASNYQFSLDANREVETESGFDGISRTYHRDSAGKVKRVEHSDGSITKYQYDGAGRISFVEYETGQEYYIYRSDGLLVETGNEDAVVQLFRNKQGQVIKEEVNGLQVHSEYDNYGARIRLASNLGANITYKRDNFGNISEVQAKAGEQSWESQITRDVFGQEMERYLPGGLRSQWRRDKFGRPVQHSVLDNFNPLRVRHYSWDQNDSLKSITNPTTGQTKFGHDGFNNLASAEYPNGDVLYKMPDEVGNLFKTKNQTDRKYGSAGELLFADGIEYKYDKQGNLIQKIEADGRIWDYKWNEAGMLAEVSRPDSEVVTFKYDPLGRRLSKTFKGQSTYWQWDGNTPIHEWQQQASLPTMDIDENGNIQPILPKATTQWIFEDGFSPVAKLQNDESYSIISDHLGTPAELYDSQGQKIWSCELDIYGKVRNLEGDREACPFRYQGQYEDIETGLYYNRFRYYAPDEGVYISQDPIGLAGGTTNLYSYVWDSNSVVDRLGLAGSPIVVIGEGQSGVDAATKALRDAGYNAESMMTPKNQWKGGVLKKGMSETKFQKAVDWNKQWLKDKIADGYKVVDIGTDGRAVRSRFYQAELDALKETNTSKIKLKKLPDGESIGDMRKRISCG